MAFSSSSRIVLIIENVDLQGIKILKSSQQEGSVSFSLINELLSNLSADV